MSKRFKRITAIAAVILLVGTFITVQITGTLQADAASITAASSTADIRVLQTKLKNLGYYTGTVDGIYGSMTTAAIKRYQSAKGLTADGIAGTKTLASLGINVGLSVSSAVIKAGSSASDIKVVQRRLKDLGYYKSSVDGIYGSGTRAAVTAYQRANGLAQDGVAGPNTLSRLGITSVGASSSNTGSSDTYLLAKCIYAEARGEPYEGQVAVGAIVLNRVKSPNFPNTIAGVIYQSGAFTAVADGQINLSPNASAQKAAQDALNGWDPTYGCIYYFNPNTATSAWIWSRKQVVTIGKHIFCV